ncbi:hypothetical protein HNO88_000982 [Novosphingobium chloroacetimidivorans]|uniref:Uncharacterized protein n=1 Tax=Novosphingobium chloroacetimidivorans TaxID=1428314 RepID=A0A7W7K856_9SPHN|nr:hypothetical protein [Novosphingobium chloroacetimidivorans]MBB4857671.1 hypothetical protein [Novosphingobium chloroacetimidivorans]
MQDDTPNVTEAVGPEATGSQTPYAPATSIPTPRRRSVRTVFLAMLLAFLAGAGGVAYLAWHGELARYLPARSGSGQSSATDGARDGIAGTASGAGGSRAATPNEAVVSMEARLAMLEDRFSRLDFEASAASGNAARAEALLIASAARRLIERGEPLSFVADQLTLRFGDAQPQAVQTITTFASNPVTLDQLTARLEALAPDLTDKSQSMNLWSRTRQELANLFTVRSDSPTLLTPAARIDRARLMLTARRIDNAIDEVERMPGADAAQKWIADARRFEEAQRALDLVETTAMLEPRRLRDGSGQDVTQPSPLSAPEPSPVPTAVPTAR